MTFTIFNRAAVMRHRDYASYTEKQYFYLFEIIYARLLERIKGNFTNILHLGCSKITLTEVLPPTITYQRVFHLNLSYKMVCQQLKGYKIVGDEEYLPFTFNSFDLVISVLNLSTVNDLPGTLLQIKNCLKKNGIFIATLLGGKTLQEIQHVFNQSPVLSLYPRLHPYLSIKDSAQLLQRVGFTAPVADTELITIYYKNAQELLADIKKTGQSNSLNRSFLGLEGKNFINSFYQACESLSSQNQGEFPITIELITITGIKP